MMDLGIPLACRRRRALILVIATLALLTFYMTSLHDFNGMVTKLSPDPNAQKVEEKKPQTGQMMPPGPRTAEQPMSYGTAQQPVFRGPGKVINTDKLSPEHIPSRTNSKRLIVVGDVHGMLESFKELLNKVGFDAAGGKDHVIMVGDLVNKGPDSAGVIDHAMAIGARAVRGNHDDRVLLAHAAIKQPGVVDTDKYDGADAIDALEQIHFSHGDYADRSTARTLSDKHVEWLSSQPVILQAGNVEGFHNLVFVHAGLVPGLDLEHQSPWAAMNMRTLVYPREQLRRVDAKKRIEKWMKERASLSRPISNSERDLLVDAEVERTTRPSDKRVVVPVDGRDGDPWAEVWNRWQKKEVSDDEKMTVVYGHDSKQGLSVGPFTYGLDTGCVYGGELTALVIEGTPEGVRHEIVQVNCRKAKTMDEGESV